jgi:hypothetical protein
MQKCFAKKTDMSTKPGYNKIVLMMILFAGFISLMALITILIHHEIEVF